MRGTMSAMTSTPEGDQSPWTQPSRPNSSGSEYGTGAGWGGPPDQPGYGQPASGQPGYGQPDHVAPSPSTTGAPAQHVPPGYPSQPGYPPQPTAPAGYAALQTALRPGIVPLRPLTVGEVLDGAFRSVRANPGVMFGMTALVVTIAVVAQALLQWYVQGILAGTMSRAFAGVDEELFLAETMAVSLAQLLTTTPTLGIAISVLTGLLIVSVSRSVIGQRASAAHVWEKVRPRVGALVAFSILLNLVFVLAAGLIVALVLIFAGMDQIGLVVLTILVGLLIMTVVAVWLLVRTLLVPAVLVLEGQKLWAGVARGWRLTRGSFWRILGVAALAIVIVVVVTSAIALPGTIISGIVFPTANPTDLAPLLVNSVVLVIAQTISTVFLAAVIALQYIDVRMRREGLDVALARAAADAA